MKLIIGGSTGFVSAELIRLALLNDKITSIVGLARRETKLPDGASDPSGKLACFVVDDFEDYSAEVKAHLADADAAIWTIAVTPSKFKEVGWDQTVKICRDYAHYGLATIAAAPRKPTAPLRFVYISGHFAPRPGDTGAPAAVLEDHGLTGMAQMRGAVEAYVLDYAKNSHGKLEAMIAKPGFITTPGRTAPAVPGLPSVPLESIAAALVNQSVNGFAKDTLSNADLIEIAQRSHGG